MTSILNEWENGEMPLDRYCMLNGEELQDVMCYSNVDGRFLVDPVKFFDVDDAHQLYVTCEFEQGGITRVNVGI